MSDKDAAQIMKINTSKLASYNKLIDAVQKLALKRVDIRACNIGSNEYTMSDLRKFFNCHTLSAPKIYDTFGPIPVGKITSDSVVWNRWLRQHRNAKITGKSPDRFALDYTIDKRIAISCIAESKLAVTNWVGKNLPNGKYSGGPLFYHGVTDKSEIIFSGNAKFRSFIAEAVKGKEPSKKIDLDDFDF